MRHQFARAMRAVVMSCVLAVAFGAAIASAATFTVNSTGDAVDASINAVCDTGATIAGGAAECSLRAALAEANATPGADVIQFNIPSTDAGCTVAGVCTIQVTTGAPQGVLEATAPVTIDGSTQPGNAAVCTDAIPARPSYRIVLDGDSIEPGLRLAAGSSGSTIRGLNLRNFLNTIAIIASSNNTIACNFIGTDETGNAAASGNADNGIVLGCSSTGNVIGGANAADGNLVAAHPFDGVQIVGGGCPPDEPNGNFVLGNFIGVAKSGVAALGNGLSGISVFDGSGPDGTQIGSMPDGGGGSTYRGNVIGGNVSGIYLGAGVSATVIVANAIGTDLGGTVDLGNAFGGIESFAEPVQIGGTDPAARNLIAYNGDGGAMIYDTARRNRIQRNSIYRNRGLGIDLALIPFAPDGVTPNDPGDTDSGPNDLQNFPVLKAIAAAGTDLNVTFSVPSPGTLTIEFFAADGGQGRTFLGEATYALNGADAVATLPPGPVVEGMSLVATATDAQGNTSEFSAPLRFGPPAVVQPVPVGSPAAILLLLATVVAIGRFELRRRERARG
jgi:CSLREA domain-containing protein